jgi:uncharacterized delta-60 repeat protein
MNRVGIVLVFLIVIGQLYATDHHLDTTFSGTGYVTTDFSSGSTQDEARGIITTPDQKIIVVGYSENDIAAVRYRPNGQLDTSFGGTGLVTTNVKAPDGYGSYYETANHAAVQTDGKLVVVGRTSASAFVLRYTANGQLDSSFNNNGKMIIPTTLSQNTFSEARAVVIQPDTKIIFTGYAELSNGKGILLARLNPDGSYDNSFGANGTALITLPVAFTNLEVSAIALQNNGKIITAGTVWRDYTEYFFAARYQTNGSLDTGFGQNGFWFGDVIGHAYDLAFDAQGRLVIGGVGSGTALITRLNVNGTLDTGFGDNGFASTPDAVGAVGSIALDAAGRILFGSQSSYEQVGAVALRFSPDGQLDTTFGDNGRVLTQFDTYLDINDVTVDTQGKVLAAGYIFKGGVNNTQFLVMRYLNSGTSSANGGVVNGDFESGSLNPWKLTQTAGNKLMCGKGRAHDGNCNFQLMAGVLRQKINGSSLNAGDTLSLELWASGKNLLPKASAKLIVQYKDGQRGVVARKLGGGTYSYTHFQTDTLMISGAVKKLTVKINYPGGQGKLWVDGVRLVNNNAATVTNDGWIPLP